MCDHARSLYLIPHLPARCSRTTIDHKPFSRMASTKVAVCVALACVDLMALLIEATSSTITTNRQRNRPITYANAVSSNAKVTI